MKYRKLGKTDLNLSEIGLGTAQIGGPSFIGGRYIGSPPIERREGLKILNHAFRAGINFYDTSDKYGDGNAERLMGEAFKGKRDQVVIATKCGITREGDRCFKSEYIRSRLVQSLRNLKTDYIDLFQLTKPNMNVIMAGEIYEAFDNFKCEGKIRFAGVSTGTDQEAIRLIEDDRIDALQIFYNMLHVEPNGRVVPYADESDIGIIVRSPLSSGILGGKYDMSTKFSRRDDRSLFLFGKTLETRLRMIDEIKATYSLNDALDLLHFSLNYLLSNPRITTIIPGVSRTEQLFDVLKMCDIERLNPTAFIEIENCLLSITQK